MRAVAPSFMHEILMVKWIDYSKAVANLQKLESQLKENEMVLDVGSLMLPAIWNRIL